MRNLESKLLTVAVVTLLLAAAATAPHAAESSELTIRNKSNWALHELYMSTTKEDEWGPDQLGRETIESGETFMLKNIPCATYDIKVVDEDGDECVITGEKFCGHEATWTLKDADLLACQNEEEDDE